MKVMVSEQHWGHAPRTAQLIASPWRQKTSLPQRVQQNAPMICVLSPSETFGVDMSRTPKVQRRQSQAPASPAPVGLLSGDSSGGGACGLPIMKFTSGQSCLEMSRAPSSDSASIEHSVKPFCSWSRGIDGSRTTIHCINHPGDGKVLQVPLRVLAQEFSGPGPSSASAINLMSQTVDVKFVIKKKRLRKARSFNRADGWKQKQPAHGVPADRLLWRIHSKSSS
jgi:hypothetical protein